MKDRVPLYPGRVKMVPVPGQENVYNMTRADQPTQEGDPLNKATLLKDATAALFGLGADSVPDDVLAYLGKYAQHWWKRRQYQEPNVTFNPEEKITLVSGDEFYERQIEYSSAIDISGSSAELKSPQTLRVSYNTYTNANTLKGKYFKHSDGKIYFVDTNAANATRKLVTYRFEVYINAKSIKSVSPGQGYGEWEYLQSSDRSAYPDSGVQDGYEYQYLGIPFDNAVTPPKIATGSYVGTGTYGKDHPNSLTFDFTPQVIFMDVRTANDYNTIPQYYIMFHGAPYTFAPGDSSRNVLSWTNNGVSWYFGGRGSSAASGQFNTSGVTYYYIAIG